MEVNAILLLIFLALAIIFMIIEIARAVWSWKKEKAMIRREEDLSLRMKRITINELRKQYGMPPIGEEESDEPNT